MKFVAGGNAQVPNEFYDEAKNVVAPYIEQLNIASQDTLYTSFESTLALVSDTELFGKTKTLAEKKKTRALKYVFVCGIGGSNLGAQALYEAQFLFLDKFLEHKPRIVFIDTTNSNFMNHLLLAMNFLRRPNDFLLVGITKSGMTTETAVNIEIIIEHLSQKFTKKAVYERTVFVTEEGPHLWEEAHAKKISVLPIPKKVGGRFSVFSPAGLFPLFCTDISVETLIERARGAREWCLHKDLNDNPAFASACFLYYHLKHGKSITNTFFFNSEYETLGKWYRQLLGESLGKETDKKEGLANAITPIISIGSTDLHSVAQLFFGGPKDKTTTFVRLRHKDAPYIEASTIFSLVQGIAGKSQEEIMDALYEGTKRAYTKAGLPFIEVLLEDFYDSAAFMQFKMFEVMILAHLLGVNAFTQPHVENYKIEAKKILEG